MTFNESPYSICFIIFLKLHYYLYIIYSKDFPQKIVINKLQEPVCSLSNSNSKLNLSDSWSYDICFLRNSVFQTKIKVFRPCSTLGLWNFNVLVWTQIRIIVLNFNVRKISKLVLFISIILYLWSVLISFQWSYCAITTKLQTTDSK